MEEIKPKIEKMKHLVIFSNNHIALI